MASPRVPDGGECGPVHESGWHRRENDTRHDQRHHPDNDKRRHRERGEEGEAASYEEVLPEEPRHGGTFDAPAADVTGWLLIGGGCCLAHAGRLRLSTSSTLPRGT